MLLGDLPADESHPGGRVVRLTRRRLACRQQLEPLAELSRT